jgi:hypothetical protein
MGRTSRALNDLCTFGGGLRAPGAPTTSGRSVCLSIFSGERVSSLPVSTGGEGRSGGCHREYGLLLVPALVSLVLLFFARRLNTHPRDLEPASHAPPTKGFGRITASNDVAFSHSLNRVGGTTKTRQRAIVGCAGPRVAGKANGNRLIVHEQDSVPVDVRSGKASRDPTGVAPGWRFRNTSDILAP